MNIFLINGSPKHKDSASGMILNELKEYLQGNTVTECACHATAEPTGILTENFGQVEALVFAFPLYVDGIPSHFLRCLAAMEGYFKNKPSGPTVYSIVNSGFFEGKQNALALDLMKCWCEKAHVRWGQGVGIGGGGMLTSLERVSQGHGPRKNPSRALLELTENLTAQRSAEDIFVAPNFPRFLYRAAAEMDWKRQIKQNGLHPKDLYLQK